MYEIIGNAETHLCHSMLELIHLHMRKSQIKMPTRAELLIKNSTILLLVSFGAAVVQAFWLGASTTVYPIAISSTFCFCEVALLILTLYPSLKNKQTRLFLTLLTTVEIVLFFLHKPIAINESLLMLIFLIRIYVLVGLYRKDANKFYEQK